jgi:hypothetical protein
MERPVDDGRVLRMFLIGYENERLGFVVYAVAVLRTDAAADERLSIASFNVDVRELRRIGIDELGGNRRFADCNDYLIVGMHRRCPEQRGQCNCDPEHL